MNVKYRIIEEVLRYLNETASPDGQVDFWNLGNVVGYFDELDITSLNRMEDTWHYTVHFEGILRVSLLINPNITPPIDPRSNNFDTFIDKVINQEILITADPGIDAGEISEKARAQLIKLMEVPANDSTEKKTHLLFSVNAYLMKKIRLATQPEIWVGQTPDIGNANIDQYELLD